jgi:hypothetical protein
VVRNTNGQASPPAARVIQVGNQPPVPVIGTPSPPAGAGYGVGQLVTVTGSATDPEDGPVPAANLSWKVWLYHVDITNPGNTHRHPHTEISGASTISFTVPPPEDIYAGQSYLTVELVATDSAGLTGLATPYTVNPRRTTVSFRTVPSGLALTVQGYAITPTVPYTMTVWPNWQMIISAPPFQAGAPFEGWSDGGEATHTITVPSSPLTYTATYGAAPALNNKVYLPFVIR